MPDEEDWLMRPVLRGLCTYESLKEGRIDLADIARMNDAIDADYENDRRFHEANE